jgi:hypothetical protein
MSYPPLASSAQPADLVPLHVDACTDDGHVRIIDTLLFDPSCWPIPLLPPLHASVEHNVRELAHTIISDSEVYGMGRTVRHFTNRVDLWSPKLQELVEEQLRVQLWDIINNHGNRCQPPVPKSYTTNTNNDNNNSSGSGSSSGSTITPISLRLAVNNVSISDDFDWDRSVPTCPIVFATTLAQELNAPSEAAVAIATSIVEQLHGIPVSPGKATTNVTTAVLLESRDNVANIAHAVALHRPPNLDRTIP